MSVYLTEASRTEVNAGKPAADSTLSGGLGWAGGGWQFFFTCNLLGCMKNKCSAYSTLVKAVPGKNNANFREFQSPMPPQLALAPPDETPCHYKTQPWHRGQWEQPLIAMGGKQMEKWEVAASGQTSTHDSSWSEQRSAAWTSWKVIIYILSFYRYQFHLKFQFNNIFDWIIFLIN